MTKEPTKNVWDDPVFVAHWNATYGIDMSGSTVRQDIVFPLLRERFMALSGKILIDAGCGNGNLLRMAATDTRLPFETLIGIDGGKAIVDSARKESTARIDGITYIHKNLASTTAPYSLQGDHVTSVFVLEEIPTPNLGIFFTNLARVTKKKGNIHIFTNHPAYALLLARENETNPKFPGHKGYFDQSAVPYTLSNLNTEQGVEATATYHHKTLASILNAAAKAKLRLTETIEIPTGVPDLASLGRHEPNPNDYPRFLYMRLRHLTA